MLVRLTTSFSRFTGLEDVARAQHAQGKMDLAEMNVREALGLVGRHWEESDLLALNSVVWLERLLHDLGVDQKVAQLKTERERRMMLCKITDDE